MRVLPDGSSVRGAADLRQVTLEDRHVTLGQNRPRQRFRVCRRSSPVTGEVMVGDQGE